MVLFDQLRISDDGKKMFINAHVNRAEEFKDRYIKSITILTADKVSETNPWNTSESAEYIYREAFDEEGGSVIIKDTVKGHYANFTALEQALPTIQPSEDDLFILDTSEDYYESEGGEEQDGYDTPTVMRFMNSPVFIWEATEASVGDVYKLNNTLLVAKEDGWYNLYGAKQINLVITPEKTTPLFTKTNFSSDLFFVYIEMSGTPDECIPCYISSDYTLGVTFDENLLYQKVMQFTKDLADACNIPVGFTDFILLWNAFKASIETEHYSPAIKYYNMLFDKGIFGAGINKNSKRCGCNG